MQASSQPRTAVRPKASVWGTTRIPFYAATCASLLAREPAHATCTGNDRSQDDERRMEDMVKHITPCSMSSPVAPHVGPKAIVCVGRQASPLFSLLRRMCDEPSRRGPWPVRVVDSPCLPMSVPLKVVERQNGQKTTHKSSLLLDTADNVSDTAFLCPTQQGERPVDSPFGGVVSPPYASFRPQGGTSGTGAHEAVGEGAGQPPG
ncbi:hypothetical protein ACCO45_013180 [Purpureocillium lilacinum]|uniref:Uncharacterized protein n=1 Tax=Purpureocillium lilacinum TaxID=33203 RepID=A0ACC4DBM4_PURLI